MKIKIIILFSFFLLICGCEDWDAIYEEYGDILDSGFTCTYDLSSDTTPDNGITRLTFTGSSEGIYVSYNGGSNNLLINNNNDYENYHVINDFNIYYDRFDYNVFLEEYSQTGTCPKNIYLYLEENYYRNDVVETCPYGEMCYTYSNKQSSGDNLGSETDQCNVANAIVCKTFEKDMLGTTIRFELGFERLADNSVSRYLIVTDQNTGEGGNIGRENTNSISVSLYGNQTFMVLNPENIYLSSNGTYSIDNIRIVDDSNSDTYFILSVNDDTVVGGTDLGEAEEYDPDKVEDPGQELEPLEIVDIEFCEENGVRRAFQIVGYLFYAAKIIVPLLLIIFGTIDFAKATIASDEKAPKDAALSLAKRIIGAIIIFLIPTILNFLISLINNASEHFSDSKYKDCTDCLLDPFGECQAGDVVSGDSEEE